MLDRRDAVIARREFRNVTINKDRMTFLSHHWIVPQHLFFE